MTEREMEDLIAQYPEEFFPGRGLVLKGRQESFSGIGRFDLLFEDLHKTKILMELKAKPAKYENANQLAKYKQALEQQGEKHVIMMWLVAPLISTPIREFMDHVGIQYTEIHEVDFRHVAARHDYSFASEAGSRTKDVASTVSGTQKKSIERGSRWSWGAAPSRGGDVNEFLSRCDERGKKFFSELFEAVKSVSNKAKITWDHESGFSLKFYFPRLKFVPMVWGFPATNKEEKHRKQVLTFVFDRAARRGVPDEFIVELGQAITGKIACGGGDKQLTIQVADLDRGEADFVIKTIIEFAQKASTPVP